MYRYSLVYIMSRRFGFLCFVSFLRTLHSRLCFFFDSLVSCLLSLVSCLLSLDTLGRHLLSNTFLTFFSTSVCNSSGVWVCVCVHFYLITSNRAIRPCHSSHSITTSAQTRQKVFVWCVFRVLCVCVYLIIKLHITAQSGLVILVILCHTRIIYWASQGGINDTYYENLCVCVCVCIY